MTIVQTFWTNMVSCDVFTSFYIPNVWKTPVTCFAVQLFFILNAQALPLHRGQALRRSGSAVQQEARDKAIGRLGLAFERLRSPFRRNLLSSCSYVFLKRFKHLILWTEDNIGCCQTIYSTAFKQFSGQAVLFWSSMKRSKHVWCFLCLKLCSKDSKARLRSHN